MGATNYPSMASTLSTLVVEALVLVGLTQDDILTGPIEHTNLPWQIPPLIVESTIFDVPLSEYLDTVIWINPEALDNMMSDAIFNLKNSPQSVLGAEGYKGTSYVIPNVRSSERQIHFSLPEGFPDNVTDSAVAMLCLECAHVMRKNAKLKSFGSDDSNYYAEMMNEQKIGIVGGLPSIGSEVWDISVEGMVQELLRTPRGELWEGCDYNIIAKVRSVVTKHSKLFRDFDAVDWMLQTLRVVDGQQELLDAVRSIKKVANNRKLRLLAVRECVVVVNQMAITDRQRIETLKGMLVPDFMSSGKFSKTIFGYYKVPPPVLQIKVLTRIKENIENLCAEEERLYADSNRFTS